MIARTSQLFFTCIQLFLLGALPLASLADLYVSASGTYDGQPAYVDLQAAIDAAVVGATIWVEDGFVCETGKTDLAENACRILIDKAVTVRSRSGTLQNPAVIRGAWHDPANEIPLGVHAIRCVRMTSSNARLIGFRLEGGATADSDDWTATAGSGGGFLGSGVLSNCLITANQAASGGGASGILMPSFVGCVISNNVAKLNAGGVKSANCVNTTIVGNHSDGSCGGFRTINASACLIVGNVAATSGGGGIAVGNTFTDCVVTNNEAGTDGGGIHYTPTLFRCLVGWNRAAGAGGGVHGGAGTAPVVAYDSMFVGNRAGGSGGGARYIVATNCIFAGNFSGGVGGGAAGTVLTDCRVTDNVASNSSTWGNGCGGGFADGVISNSLVASNHARGGATVSPGFGTGGGVYGSNTRVVNCVVSNNTSDSRGGGIHLATGYNNLVVDNVNGSNGGGVCGGTHYNSLILRNTSTSTGGGAGYQTTLVNCTVLENTAPTRAGVQDCWLVNTITWGNTGGADKITTATNSCGLACTDAVGPGNTTADPKIITSGVLRDLPGPGSPCLNRGLAFSWMTDRSDIRSRDRNGRRRVIDGRVDMGALEAPTFGTMLTVR